jgi:protease-4
MSNAAASGGYYISMKSDKIFANATTLTGSIGVFGIKFDASKWANSYGITGDYFPYGSHGAALHPLTPLTPSMKNNISRIVLDYYDYFKSIVSNGRSLSLNEVEEVAQGRVWTGEQAKEVGLVDAMGGLDRAIAYAKRTFTTTDHVEVHHYPRRQSLLEDLPDILSSHQLSWCARVVSPMFTQPADISSQSSTEDLMGKVSELSFANKPHIMLTMDESTAIDVILNGE